MKESTCERSITTSIRDEALLRHAADCSDCREMLLAAEWMTNFAERTPVRQNMPPAGFLIFKARLENKFLAAERAARPVRVMIVAAGLLVVAALSWLTLSAGSPFGSIMTEALMLLWSYAGAIALGAFVVAFVCAGAAYLGNLNKD